MLQTIETVCCSITDAEDKLPSLRIRNIKNLLRWLGSIDTEYAISEDVDLFQIAEMQNLLQHELWLRKLQLRGEIK
jgi:hypothetical protein